MNYGLARRKFSQNQYIRSAWHFEPNPADAVGVPLSMSAFTALLVVFTAIDLAAAVASVCWVVRRRRRLSGDGPVTLADIGLAIGLASGVFMLKLPPAAMLGVHAFGALHLVYLDLAIVLPLVAGGLLVAAGPSSQRPKRVQISPAVRAAAVVSLAAAPCAAYATYIEPYRLEVIRQEIVFNAPIARPAAIKVAVVSDLQFATVTDHERDAVDQVMAWKPDLVLLPGDLLQCSQDEFDRELPAARDLLSRFHAPGGVYVVKGDVDSRDGLRAMVDGLNVRFLYNEVIRTTVQGVDLAIAGITNGIGSPQLRATLDEVCTDHPDADLRLLLAHRPEMTMYLPESCAIDVVIAGHTHGGQVQLPFIGPIIIASPIPRHMGAGGLHVLDGTRLYVSRGVGMERGQAPKLRFLCRPEISHLTFQVQADPSYETDLTNVGY